MIAGTLVMEDHIVQFKMNGDEAQTASVTVVDVLGQSEETHTETYTCNAVDLSKALAIALHWNGTPNAAEDYPAAERAQGRIRWIP